MLIFGCLLLQFSCEKEQLIVPDSGYDWPRMDRLYWPTEGWLTAPLSQHGIDVDKIQIAADFAANDDLSRAMLVVKNGYLVFEEYYHGGAVDASTNLWSVTKSISSALVGMMVDDGLIQSTDQRMADLMPAYPEFGNITLHHVLTMSTGLSWAESGPLWVEWIFSDDWVTSALARGQEKDPGERFFYSSGNSHFLTALVKHVSHMSVGILAKSRLFDPMGVVFNTLEQPIVYNDWSEYTLPLSQTWRRDPKGIECASFGLYLTARDMAKFGYLYLNLGRWEDQQLIPREWVISSTKDHMTNIYGRYSYGYQWYITLVDGHPAFLASGFGGQIIGVVPDLDMVVVLKYDALNPVHPEPGTTHDDMHLFELIVQATQ